MWDQGIWLFCLIRIFFSIFPFFQIYVPKYGQFSFNFWFMSEAKPNSTLKARSGSLEDFWIILNIATTNLSTVDIYGRIAVSIFLAITQVWFTKLKVSELDSEPWKSFTSHALTDILPRNRVYYKTTALERVIFRHCYW